MADDFDDYIDDLDETDLEPIQELDLIFDTGPDVAGRNFSKLYAMRRRIEELNDQRALRMSVDYLDAEMLRV